MESVKEKIKRCPFDAGKGYTMQNEKNLEWFVRCRTCLAQKGGFSTKEEAIASWETRVYG